MHQKKCKKGTKKTQMPKKRSGCRLHRVVQSGLSKFCLYKSFAYTNRLLVQIVATYPENIYFMQECIFSWISGIFLDTWISFLSKLFFGKECISEHRLTSNRFNMKIVIFQNESLFFWGLLETFLGKRVLKKSIKKVTKMHVCILKEEPIEKSERAVKTTKPGRATTPRRGARSSPQIKEISLVSIRYNL